MNKNNVIWKSVTISDFFEVVNLAPLHKVNLIRDPLNGVPYITRTEKNNGIEDFVKCENFQLHKGQCITFGAETVNFFYQPYDFLCGNKMYGVYRKDGKVLTHNQGIFLQRVFKNSLRETGYGYGLGLTGTRFKRRSVKLPVDGDSIAWSFIELLISKLSKNVREKLPKLSINKITDSRELDELEWKQFKIDEIFIIKNGVRLTKANMKAGNNPFVGATDNNNGITGFTSVINNSLDDNVLGVNYNGSVVETFYHPYKALFSDDVKRLKLKNYPNNKYVLLFMKTVIVKQKSKYTYGYKFNSARMKGQIILLPIRTDGTPNYNFMEQYMKRQENKIINRIVQEEADC